MKNNNEFTCEEFINIANEYIHTNHKIVELTICSHKFLIETHDSIEPHKSCVHITHYDSSIKINDDYYVHDKSNDITIKEITKRLSLPIDKPDEDTGFDNFTIKFIKNETINIVTISKDSDCFDEGTIAFAIGGDKENFYVEKIRNINRNSTDYFYKKKHNNGMKKRIYDDGRIETFHYKEDKQVFPDSQITYNTDGSIEFTSFSDL